jgi:hypothetical protein
LQYVEKNAFPLRIVADVMWGKELNGEHEKEKE